MDIVASQRVLIVDDYRDSAEMISEACLRLGATCSTVGSGSAALAQIYSFEPSLVILDLGLPDMTGYEVARVLRRLCGARLYIAALTGWTQPDRKRLALEAGCDEFMLKPATTASISRTLKASAHRQERYAIGGLRGQ